MLHAARAGILAALVDGGSVMKILVIDDDDGVRRTVEKILLADGHEVYTAADGLRGLAVARQKNPQIVITDIIMPEQEGIETILAIQRDLPEIKIIAMSGGASVGDLDVLKMAQLLGAHDILQKPFGAGDLRDRVRALMADGKAGVRPA